MRGRVCCLWYDGGGQILHSGNLIDFTPAAGERLRRCSRTRLEINQIVLFDVKSSGICLMDDAYVHPASPELLHHGNSLLDMAKNNGLGNDRPSQDKQIENASSADVVKISTDGLATRSQDTEMLNACVGKGINSKAICRFHRDACRFSNASLETKAALIDAWEKQLADDARVEKWDCVCSLIRKIAAALSNPRPMPVIHVGSAREPEDAIERLRARLQEKTRKLLCQGLRLLDLTDVGTTTLLEPALQFIRGMISKFEQMHGSTVADAQAGKTWKLLQSILSDGRTCMEAPERGNTTAEPTQTAIPEFGARGHVFDTTFELSANAYAATSALQISKGHDEHQHAHPSIHWADAANREAAGSKRRKTSKENWARITDTYEPSTRHKSFATVAYYPEKKQLLTCSSCGMTITSAWFFTHPRTKLEKLLVPRHGCRTCRQKFKRICPYNVLDGIPRITDAPPALDYCQHMVQRHLCRRCDSRFYCTHGKRIQNCKVCYTRLDIRPN